MYTKTTTKLSLEHAWPLGSCEQRTVPINTPLHYPLDQYGFTETMHESLVFRDPKFPRVLYNARGHVQRGTRPDRMSSPNGTLFKIAGPILSCPSQTLIASLVIPESKHPILLK